MASNQLAQAVNAICELRPGVFRIGVRWGVVEPTQGHWDFARVDDVVSQIPQTAEIMAILQHIPTWANGVDPSSVTGWPEAYMPTNLTAWSNYVFTVADRYGGRIKYWEVLNEPNGRDYFRPEPDPALYTTLLKLAYGAIKRANTNCLAVLGGLQGNGVDPFIFEPVPITNFLENIYMAGGKDYFDICAIHPYVPSYQGAGEILRLTRKTLEVMAANGDTTKPLWFSEIGFGAADEITDAKLMCETFYITALEPRIQRIIWYRLDAVGESFSMLDSDGRRKPSFRAFQAVTSPAFPGYLNGSLSGQQSILVTLLGQPEANYHFESSTILLLWNDLVVRRCTDGFVQFVDTPIDTRQGKFYRTSKPAFSSVHSPPGLVAFWTGDDTASDNSGTNHGTLTGGATYAGGVVNRSFIFDGVDDTVVIPASSSLDFHDSTPMTLEMWAYRIGTAAGQNMIGKRFGCGGDPNEIQYQMSFDAQRGLTFGSYRRFVETHQELPLLQWTHLAATFDGSTLRFFINGNLAGTTNGLLGPVVSAPLKLGGSGDCIPFYGVLDEVSVYSRALSQSEIQAIVEAGSRGKCR